MTGAHRRAGAPAALDGAGLRIGVVRARWNDHIVSRLAQGARRGLLGLGVEDIAEVAVPGAFELPMAARILASSGLLDAIVCVGCVIRGETTHYELVAGESAAGIQQVQLSTGVPVAFGVLTTEDEGQALARSQGPGGHNLGEESALVAVEMARLAGAWQGRAGQPGRGPGARVGEGGGAAPAGPARGVVVAFDEERGLGVVRSWEGIEHPFHCAQIADGSRSIEVGAAVSYQVRPGPLGRWEAAQIELGRSPD